MIKKLLSWFFKIKGWRIESGIPANINKCVIIVAPHTSNWDFIYGVGAAELFKIEIKFLAKKELFVFPFKNIFLSLGGIAVDRSKHNSLVDNIIYLFNTNNNINVVFPPEGTRKKTPKWKTGFYHAAIGAKVPILFGYIDYKRKTVGLSDCFYPSGDKEKDFEIIRHFYSKVTPKIPDNFSLPILD